VRLAIETGFCYNMLVRWIVYLIALKHNRRHIMVEEYLAIIPVGSGGSYFRGGNKEEAAIGVLNQVKKDWKGIVDLGEPRNRKVVVWDITGYDDVYWEDVGRVFDESTNKPLDESRRSLVEVHY